jgi:hypothetical protein
MLFSLLNALLKRTPVFVDARLRECALRKAGQADSLNRIAVEWRRWVRAKATAKPGVDDFERCH